MSDDEEGGNRAAASVSRSSRIGYGAGRRVLVCLAALAVSIGFVAWFRPTASDVPAAKMIASGHGATDARPGSPAPDFVYPTLEGSQSRLSQFRGRPVVLSLWASWCRPCEQEMPDLQRLQDQYRAQGLVVLGLNVGETRGDVRSFVREMGVTYAVGLDPDLTVSTAYHAVGLPMTIFIDGQGVIREAHLGQLNLDEMQQLVHTSLRELVVHEAPRGVRTEP